ncbi:hypothetical protein JQ628_23875 [Bradyrhizobium lablabi]|uniref:hypothetical protein n=1 Tax=Bradyrhizobium lablabi TaxID=722472 RepID=UPI001BA572E7|nr:hypothetical protein [Bradyrhizobium lablabi]MBR1124583.1 hypothetical protein [Bradyrhizobium lablabi]
MPYALFDRDRQIGESWPSETEVWKRALERGLISDVPVADVSGERVLPTGYHVRELREQRCEPDPAWKLPNEIS